MYPNEYVDELINIYKDYAMEEDANLQLFDTMSNYNTRR
jgi:hypothetical protein